MRFTFQEYRDILKCLLENGYEFASYADYGTCTKPCILRHDVDYSPEKAVQLSAREAAFRKETGERMPCLSGRFAAVCAGGPAKALQGASGIASQGGNGCFSTFFMRVTSSFYHIHAKPVRMAMESILADGNEIGLHFDPCVYEIKDEQAFVQYAENEAFLLGKTLGRTVTAVSMHRPAAKVLSGNIQFETLTNAYSETFFHTFKYISDSSMRWRENPFETIQSGQHDRLHILTHAFWYAEQKETKESKLADFVKQASAERLEAYLEDEPHMRERIW